MRVQLEIIALETNGDELEVRGQAKSKRDPDWRPMQTWRFTVPEYYAKHYRIGQILHIEVKP